MRPRREAKILKAKALSSLRRACTAYNASDEDGRVTSFLLHFQHAFEMLLKAGLVQNRVNLVGRDEAGKSAGFKKCVALAENHLRLSSEDAGLLRTLDGWRDEEQHWCGCVSEEILYMQARAGVTLFDEMLQRIFDERLHDHLPHRILPLSASPPRDIQLLLDEEFSQVADMLRPGKRRRVEARAHIRSLLALQAHFLDEEVVNQRDVDKVERMLKRGDRFADALPLLHDLSSNIAGDGITVRVHFTRSTDASLPVRFASQDEVAGAAPIREVDRQEKYHWSPTSLATKLELTSTQALALRRYLKLDEDETCCHVFPFGKSTRFTRFSDNALEKMRNALRANNIADVHAWYQSQLRKERADAKARSNAELTG